MRARAGPLLLGALLAALAVGFGPRPGALAAADERILDFESRILVHGSGAITVAETIRVVATGKQIKRGIYRDFPTTYRDRAGNTMRVSFEVLSVERDGRPEPYFVKAVSNGKRVYIGRENVFLKPGTYRYTLTYRSDRQIGFFDDFDALYWNVTGNGWDFAIEHARAVVELPPGAEVLNRAAYTGPQGATGSDVTMGREGRGISFATTRTLNPFEGLTITVAWPKGFVHEPSLSERVGFLFRDRAGLLAALVGLGLLTIYYLLIWLRVGRDPPPGTIIPLFAPPRGFSPAALRFVMRMGYDDKVFAAAVVIMAVKGYLTITEDGDGDFTLKKTGRPESKLSAGERKVAQELFRSDREVELKTANHARVGGALKALKKSLRADFEKLHFARNLRYLAPGLIISLLALGAIVSSAGDEEAALFMCAWLSGWTVACYFLVTRALGSWRGGSRAAAVGGSLFAAPFLAGEVMGLWIFSQATSLAAAAVLVMILLTNVLFYHLLRAPTVAGRRVMDQIEGFKLYLTVAEGERLAAYDPPEKTPELFEKYLPHALALDVENEWSEQFAATLAAAGSGEGSGYRPGWYRGGTWSGHGPGGLASQLGGSLSGAISSSSTAPGSSSGGSSGGGGGGGGGGGW